MCPPLCGGSSVLVYSSGIDVYVLSTHNYVHLEEMCLSFENYINVVCGM